MESLGTAVLELVADVKPLVAGLEKGKAVSEEMAATTAQGFRGGITKAAIPAAAAVGALVVGLHKSLDAAEENQVSQAKLAQAFKTAGLNIEDYKDEIDKTEQASAGLGFKSEDVKAALAQMVVATHDAHSAMNLLATAQDLARYKGISLTDASKMLTSTMSGSTRAARALGIVFQPVTAATDALKAKTQYATLAAYEHAKSIAFMSDKQASAQKMVEMLNQKLGGQAQAFANTAQGAKEKMGAEFQLLEINIGNVLIPILTKVSMVLADFSQFLTEHASIVKIVIAVIGVLGTAILALVVYTKAVAAAQLLWNMAMDANPIGLIITAVAALVVAFVELWKHSQTFRDIVLGVWHDVRDGTEAFVSFFTKTVPDAVQSVWDKVTGVFHGAMNWLRNTWSDVTDLVKSPFIDAWQFIRGIPGDIVDAFSGIGKPIGKALGAVGSAIVAVFKAPINAVISLIDAIKLPSGIHIKTWHGIPDGFSIDWSTPFNIPMLAQGGIVTSPTLAMIGEAGPEAVVPLNGAGGGLGGGVTVNVSGFIGNERDLVVRLGREFQKLKTRGLDFGLA